MRFKNQKCKLLHFALILCFCLFSAPSMATPAFTVCSHPLPPHSFQSPDGTPTGQATEILFAVAKKLNWKIHINYMSWIRARMESEQGNCDMIYTILQKLEYETFAVFPKESFSNRLNILIVRKDSKIKYSGDLNAFMRKHTIGLYKDKVVSPLFDQLRKSPWAKIQDNATTPESVIKMLLHKRFDAAIENSATATYELKLLGQLDEVEFLSPPLAIVPAYIAFTKKGKASNQLAKFEEALREFKKSKEYKNILNRYEHSLQ